MYMSSPGVRFSSRNIYDLSMLKSGPKSADEAPYKVLDLALHVASTTTPKALADGRALSNPFSRADML